MSATSKTVFCIVIFIFIGAGHVFALVAPQNLSISTIINKADSEISQKNKNLSDLLPIISSLKKISSGDKNKLTALVQNEIDSLTSLKTKIDADTSLPAAKADYQSITNAYNVYFLVLPQIRIISAADQAAQIVDSMNALGVKVKSRISGNTGAGSSTINQMFSDFTAKVKDAGLQSRSAANAVIGINQANAAALKIAQASIKTTSSDLASARSNIGNIVNYLTENGN